MAVCCERTTHGVDTPLSLHGGLWLFWHGAVALPTQLHLTLACVPCTKTQSLQMLHEADGGPPGGLPIGTGDSAGLYRTHMQLSWHAPLTVAGRDFWSR